MNSNGNRPTPESLLAKLRQGERANLRVYIGAAPGVGKTYQMLEDAHLLKKQGVDIVVAVVEPHGREDTRAMIGNLECVPLRRIEYRGVTLEDMDLDAIIASNPLLDQATDHSRLLTFILAGPHSREAVEALCGQDWQPGAMALGERAAYVWCPGGILDSTAAAALGKQLGDATTARNWATLSKLHALCQELPA